MAYPNAPVVLEMRSGSVKLSLTMRQLYLVWKNWPSIWEEFNRIMGAKKITLGDIARVLYTASSCAIVDDGQDPKHATIEEFEADILPGRDGIDGIYDAYVRLMPPDKPYGIRAVFERYAKSSNSGIRLPKLKFETPEDYYVYMVMICGIEEELFWEADFAFLWEIARSKSAYTSWLAGEQERRR